MRPPLRTWVLRALRGAVVVYLGVVLVLSLIQDSLIFPGAAYKPERRPLLAAGQELIDLTTPAGEKTLLLFSPAADRPRQDAATVVLFYGNGMHLSDCLEIMALFNEIGVNAAMVDYVGYGFATGKPSEAGCYDAAEAAWAHVRSRTDIRQDLLLVGGWSLGGGSAVELAVRHPEARGIILLCSFTSMTEVAQWTMPYIPISAILKHRFESAEKLPRTTVPVFLAHGTNDDIVPHWMSERLAEIAGPRATLVLVPKVGHNGFFDEGWRAIREPLARWVETLTLTKPTTASTIPAR